jgi:hypothetical protein
MKEHQLIFQIRSQTLDLKSWQPWKYTDKTSVKCGKSDETMSHFAICEEYTSELIYNWWDIKQSDTERQKEIAKLVEKRVKARQTIVDSQHEDGQASNTGSNAPVDCEAL